MEQNFSVSSPTDTKFPLICLLMVKRPLGAIWEAQNQNMRTGESGRCELVKSGGPSTEDKGLWIQFTFPVCTEDIACKDSVSTSHRQCRSIELTRQVLLTDVGSEVHRLVSKLLPRYMRALLSS